VGIHELVAVENASKRKVEIDLNVNSSIRLKKIKQLKKIHSMRGHACAQRVNLLSVQRVQLKTHTHVEIK